jgi:hypothetical protein
MKQYKTQYKQYKTQYTSAKWLNVDISLQSSPLISL